MKEIIIKFVLSEKALNQVLLAKDLITEDADLRSVIQKIIDQGSGTVTFYGKQIEEAAVLLGIFLTTDEVKSEAK